MKVVELGNIIASRSLTRERNGASHEIVVLIGKPCKTGNFSDFLTPYQLRGVGSENIRYAVGVDAVQSLQLAMVMIGAELAALNDKPNSKITWECGKDEGDFGFPVIQS